MLFLLIRVLAKRLGHFAVVVVAEVYEHLKGFYDIMSLIHCVAVLLVEFVRPAISMLCHLSLAPVGLSL